jgi:hypothetical protein
VPKLGNGGQDLEEHPPGDGGVSLRNGISNTLRVSGLTQGAEFSGFGMAGVVPNTGSKSNDDHRK